jgi:hypothetical protein
MATYFLNAESPNESTGSPWFQTVNTGAHSLANLKAHVTLQAADIIEVVITATAVPVASQSVNCTIRTYNFTGVRATLVGISFTLSSATMQNLNHYVTAATGSFPNMLTMQGSTIVTGCNFYATSRFNWTDYSNIFYFSANSSCKFKNNLIHNFQQYGAGGAIIAAATPVTSLEFYNNTVYNCKTIAAQGFGVFFTYSPNPNSIKLKNNIFQTDAGGLNGFAHNSGQTFAGMDCSYNNVYGVSSAYGTGYTGTNNLTSNPKFASPDNAQLLAISPCLTTGIGPSSDSAVPTTDYIGSSRSGATTSMGAYVDVFTPIIAKIRSVQIQDNAITKALLAANVAGQGFGFDGGGALKINAQTNSGLVVDTNGLYVDYYKDTPTGTTDGTNTTFTLHYTPVTSMEQIFLDGVFQESGVSNDYTISGKTITFNNPPSSGMFVKAAYIVASRS